MQSVDVLSICETWLTLSQQTPNVIDDSTVIRRDRTCGSRGGGLMIVCKNNVLYDFELSNNGIECIVVMCNFPIILSLVYRPPQVPMRNFLNTLSNVIDNVDDNDPMIVLGDFNEDVMTNHKSMLTEFMQNNGFRQCVLYATTDRGTRIDLVFARNIDPYIVGCYDRVYIVIMMLFIVH